MYEEQNNSKQKLIKLNLLPTSVFAAWRQKSHVKSGSVISHSISNFLHFHTAHCCLPWLLWLALDSIMDFACKKYIKFKPELEATSCMNVSMHSNSNRLENDRWKEFTQKTISWVFLQILDFVKKLYLIQEQYLSFLCSNIYLQRET